MSTYGTSHPYISIGKNTTYFTIIINFSKLSFQPLSHCPQPPPNSLHSPLHHRSSPAPYSLQSAANNSKLDINYWNTTESHKNP